MPAAAAQPVVQWLESAINVKKKSKSKHKRRPKKLRQRRKETPRRHKPRRSPTKEDETDEGNPLDFTKPQVRPSPAPWKTEMPLEGANTPLRSNLSRYSDPLQSSYGYNRDPLNSSWRHQRDPFSSSYGFRDTLGSSMGFSRDSLTRSIPATNRLGRRDPTGSSASIFGSPTEAWSGSPDMATLLRSMNELESFIAEYNKINLCPRGRWFTLKSYLIVVNKMRSVQRSMRLHEHAALGDEARRRYAQLRMAVASVVAVAEIRLDRSQPSLDPDFLEWSQWLQDSCRRILADSQRDVVPAAVPSTFLVREMQQRGTQSPVVGAVTSVLQAALEALEAAGVAHREMARQASDLKDRVDVLLIRLRRSSADDPGLEPIVNLKRRCDAFCLQFEGAAPFGIPEDATLRERLRRGGLRVVTECVQTLTRQRDLSAAHLSQTERMEAKITELQTAQKLHNHVANRSDFARESDASFAEATFKLQEFTTSVILWWCKQAGNAMQGGWDTPHFDQQRKLLILAGETIRGLCTGRRRLPADYFLGYLTFKDLSGRFHHNLGLVEPATLLLEGNALSSETGTTLSLSREAQLKLSEGSLTMADFMREVLSSQDASRLLSAKGSSYPVLIGDQVSWADSVVAKGALPRSGLTSIESVLLERAGRLLSRGVNVTPGSTSEEFIDQAATKWLRDFVQSTGEKNLLPPEESLLELISLANEIAEPDRLPTNSSQLLRSICEALKRRLQRQLSKFWTAHRQNNGAVTVETIKALAGSIADFVAAYPDLLRSAQGRPLCRLLLDAKAVILRVPSDELHDVAELIDEAFRMQGLLTERPLDRIPDRTLVPADRAEAPPLFVEPVVIPRVSFPVSLWKKRCSFESVQGVLSTTPLHELALHHSSPLFRYVLSVKKPKHVQQLVSALEDPWQRTAEHLRTARSRAQSSYTEMSQKIDAMSQYLITLLGAGQLHSLLTTAIGLLKSKSSEPALLDPLLAFRKQVARSLREDVTVLNAQLPTFFRPVLPNDADRAGLGAAISAVNAAEFDEEDETQGLAKTMLIVFLSFCSPVDAKRLGAEALAGHLVRLSALFRALNRMLTSRGSCLLLDASYHEKQGSVEAVEQTEACDTVKGIAEHLTRQLLTLIEHEPPSEAVMMVATTSMPAVDVSLKRQLRTMLSAPLAMDPRATEDRQSGGTTAP
ncbi:MAG: hypothetical protein KVP17_004717 [Porospora cf. gigantea B]|nr:MAG: hypothetical protein KVP17_004717 [Porospora cf. gigantea B]